MYRPTKAADLQAAAVGLDPQTTEDVSVTATDGTKLNGWLIHPFGSASSDQSRPLLVYFPGNSLNRFERRIDLKEIARAGCDVLIFDYRGFGDNDGTPGQQALEADARSVWEYARSLKPQPSRQIVLFGESLGGAVLLSLWQDPKATPAAAAVILSSTFDSMPAVVRDLYPWFPFQYLLLDRWPSSERIQNVRVPVDIFHGTEDQMIGLERARSLATAAPSATFHIVEGGTHNGIPMTQLREVLRRRIP
jgi:fermentation-respiration switch protein FrsA (DUF1100 family)